MRGWVAQWHGRAVLLGPISNHLRAKNAPFDHCSEAVGGTGKVMCLGSGAPPWKLQPPKHDYGGDQSYCLDSWGATLPSRQNKLSYGVR